jgi:hypothetical protein
MCIPHWWWSVLVAAMLGGMVGVAVGAAGDQFIPLLTIREGVHGGGGVCDVPHPAHLCLDGAGDARQHPPAREWPGSLRRLGWAGVSVCL